MKMKYRDIIFLLLLFLLNNQAISGQKNKSQPLDSVLESNSEKWKVKLHKGLGKGKPEFGPYFTIEIKKLDSPVLRKKTKEGTYTGATITSASWDWDFSKYQAVEIRKAYRMLVANGSDTSEMLFSIYSVSHDKQLTFFGEMMSKDDEGKNQTLSFKKDVSGIISSDIDSLPRRFFVEDTFSRNEESASNNFGPTSWTRLYIIMGGDSLFSEPIIHTVGKVENKYHWEWQTGIFVNSAIGNHIAALKFGKVGDLSNPFYVWIRKDLSPAYQHAIASLFALLMIVKTS